MQRRTFLTLPAAWFAPATNTLVQAGLGYSRSPVNATIFCQPLVSHKTNQYMAWYGADSKLMLGARQVGDANWAVAATAFSGNAADSHSGISLGLDGEGRLHIAWDHHGHPLRYAQSVDPGGLELTAKLPMDRVREEHVTYPEFFPLPNGDLLFTYRDGTVGKGDTILKRYDLKTRKWRTLSNPFISGEDSRSAYTNRMAIDAEGNWYTSWSWREAADGGTNHDICFAMADKNGYWRKADRGPLAPAYTLKKCEVAREVPAGSELVNSGTTAFDSKRRPMICACWREKGDAAPQYRLVMHDGKRWSAKQVGERKLDFHLGGTAPQRLPLSRPLLLVDPDDRAYVIHRDDERGPGIHAWVASAPYDKWEARTLDARPVGDWEPTCDMTLWQKQNRLHLFHQRVEQAGGTLEPQPVSVLQVEL
jgi:hypothetical protein